MFDKYKVNNPTAIDFIAHLKDIEHRTNSFGELMQLKNCLRAAEGFYQALDKHLNAGDISWTVDKGRESYLSYHKKHLTGFHLKIQFNQKAGTYPKLSIFLINDKRESKETNGKIVDALKPLPSFDKQFYKTSTRSARKTSLLICRDPFNTSEDGLIDIAHFHTCLSRMENLLNEYEQKYAVNKSA